MSEAVLSAYEPSLRDRIAWAVSDYLGGDNRTRRNYLNEKVRGAVDWVPGLGDAVGVDEAKREFDAGNYGTAATQGLLSAVGSVPGAGDAIAGVGKAMFLGLGAKKLNESKLREFADIVGLFGDLKEYDRDEALKKTGFFEGDEGMPRWEISDRDAQFKFPVEHMEQMGVQRLDKFFDHPELFENYPLLREIPTHFQRGYSASAGFYPAGSALYPKGFIEMRSGAKPPLGGGLDPAEFDDKPKLIHELQHAVQEIEGWDPGYSMEHPFVDEMGAETRQVGKDLVSMFPASAQNWAKSIGFPEGADRSTLNKAWLSAHPERKRELDFMRSVQAGPQKNWPDRFLGYHVKSGEAEARNAARRRFMSADELRNTGPWITNDVPSMFRMTDADIAKMVQRMEAEPAYDEDWY